MMRHLTHPGVRELVTQGRWDVPALGVRLVWAPGRGVSLRTLPAIPAQRRALLALVGDLTQHGRDLRRCPRCGTPFLSKGKRVFCSPACTRAAMDARKAARRATALTRRQERRYVAQRQRRRPT